MPTQPRTKSSTPRLSEVARHVVVPKGVTASGWPAVEKKCKELGISFRWWQVDAGRLILAKRATGKYASTIGGTGMSIPRQVGKTFLVAAIVFALCLLRPGLTVIWSAHRMRTAEETFGKLQVFAKRRKIAPHVLKVILGSGEEEIRFRNGSRILFGARARGFGRGFDEIDVLIFDEAQILGDSTQDDMIPATNQSRQETGALLLYLGTPPKPTDNGQVFKRMREEALSGDDDDTGWIEFGADPGFIPTQPPLPLGKKDWEQVAKANPSYPDDTPPEAILRMRKKLGPESFMREGLGIWDEDVVDPDALDFRAWERREDHRSSADLVCFGIESDLGRAWSSIGGAGVRGDGVTHLEVERRRGTSWLLDEAVALNERHEGATFVVDGRGPARKIIPDLENAGLRVLTASTDDVAKSYAWFTDALAGENDGLAHGPCPVLQGQVKTAKRRLCGDSGYTFAPRLSGGDISAVKAVALAGWAAQMVAVGPSLW